MGFQDKFLLLFSSLNQVIGSPVGLDADQDTNLFGLRERGVEFIKTAKEEVAYETIETARVAAQQNTETVADMLARLRPSS